MYQTAKSLISRNHKLHSLARRVLSRPDVSGAYRPIPSNVAAVEVDLRDAWKDASIPAAQRRLVDVELRQMYAGRPITAHRVLADAVRATGGEHGALVEVGCASGYYREVLNHLLGHDVCYTGIDYSAALIAEARQHYPGIPFAVADATALPMTGYQFDILISGCVLLHVPDYARAFAESARVARSWVIFHRTPVVQGLTRHYTKSAYGVTCLEIAFGEAELFDLFRQSGLELVQEYEIRSGRISGTTELVTDKTYLCRKQ